MDDSLFNLRCLQAHIKTQVRLIRGLLFVDNTALVAHTEQTLQCITFCFADASRLFGLDVSFRKTENNAYHPTSPLAMSTQLFAYLGCIISSDATIDIEIDNRHSKANGSFGRLYNCVWSNQCLKNKTGLRSAGLWFMPPSSTGTRQD